MAADKEQFQSIYGDAESEFEAEDVSDETLSFSKEEIEEAIAEKEQAEFDEAPAKEAAKESVAEEQSAPVGEPQAEDAAAGEKDAEPKEEITPEITFEDHAYGRHHEDPDDIYTDKRSQDHKAAGDADDAEDTEDEKVSVISYILHAILFTIPVIGTIWMLVYIISSKRNAHLRHFAQIWLVTLLLIAIGAYAAVTILGIA